MYHTGSPNVFVQLKWIEICKKGIHKMLLGLSEKMSIIKSTQATSGKTMFTHGCFTVEFSKDLHICRYLLQFSEQELDFQSFHT